MPKLIDSYLLEMEIGQPQTAGEIAVFPLKSSRNPGPVLPSGFSRGFAGNRQFYSPFCFFSHRKRFAVQKLPE